MIPVILSGIYIGEIGGFSLSGILAETDFTYQDVHYGGWPLIFYVFGAMGMLWFPLWIYAAHESPIVHPYISKEEIAFINEGEVHLLY